MSNNIADCDFNYYLNYLCIPIDSDYDLSMLSIILAAGLAIQGFFIFRLACEERKKIKEMKNFEWGNK